MSLVASAAFLEAFAGILPGPDIVAHCAANNALAKFAAWAADEDSVVTLAEHANGAAPVGYTLLTVPDFPAPTGPEDIELKRIHTLASTHGTGLGPALMAQTAATLAASVPGRFALGVGASSPLIVGGWNDREFVQPYQRTRDLVTFLRKAFAGERIDEVFETFTVSGFTLGVALPEPPPILVAALRAQMLTLAGKLGDGAVINWLSAGDVATVVPYVGGKEVVARIFAVPTTDPEVARGVGRRMITAYLNVPVYADFHRWLGRADDLAAMWKRWDEGDRKGALAAIPDHLVDELIPWGSPDELRDKVAAYVEAGVTTPVLAPVVLPGSDALEIARSLAPR